VPGFDAASRTWGIELTGKLSTCAQAGFSAVRLPVDFDSQTQTEPPYQIRPELLDRVSWAIDQASRGGLAVAVCNFVYPGLMADPPGHRDRLLAIID
jgi:endoglucanase